MSKWAGHLSIAVKSEANSRDHWAKKARRVKQQRWAAGACVPGGVVQLPCSVLLIRIMGPRKRAYDDDNLRGALKACRDGIADKLKVNDGGDLVAWHYDQRRGAADGVGIVIEWGDNATR